MSAVVAPPVSPYRGLAPFEDSELDALFFFGREHETEVIVANLLASRLTVLYGPSGVGKSSILRAAVTRKLREAAPGASVVVLDEWTTEAVLPDTAGETFVILDQFEEYFLYHEDSALFAVLPDLLAQPQVHVLISLREDALAQLDAFQAQIPSVFSNRLRLEHLDRVAAEAAILGPLTRWNELTGESVAAEPGLVEAVLAEVAVEGSAHDRDRVEAPYLQLVLERVWDTERFEHSAVLRAATLAALGGARTVVRDHLQRALSKLLPAEQDLAASMFEHLVTPSGTKIAHRASDLAQYAAVPEDSIRHVLVSLTRDRIVQGADGSGRYEIFHDVLGEPIRTWREERRLERQRLVARTRHRRLIAVIVLSLAALVAVAGLAVWALGQRGTARAQARHARARALEATALQQLPIDPNRGVRLALDASRLEQGSAAEGVLRQALGADRLRLVRHTSGAVRAVAMSPGGDRIAASVAGGHVLVLDAANRRLLHEIATGHAVTGVGFVAGGATLVTASPQGVAREWNVATGQPVAVAGRIAAARGPDGRLRVIPLGGQLLATIAHVRRLATDDEGRITAAVVAEPDGEVRARLFARDGSLIRVLPEKGIHDVAFSPDGTLVATGGADGSATLRDVRSGHRLRTLLTSKTGVEALAFSPDGTLLATGGQDSGVRIWTVATGERTYFLFGHTNPVSTLAWSPDGRTVATASPDRTVLLWRVHGLVGAGSLAATLAGNGAPVDGLAFSPDGERLVTAGEDRTVRVWDARPDQQLDLLGRAPGTALAARWAGSTIVALWSSGVVKTFDAHTRKLVHVLRSADRGARFTALGVSPDGSVIAAGGADGRTEVWRGRTGASMGYFGGSSPVVAVVVSSRGGHVASADRDGVVSIWPRGAAKTMWWQRIAAPRDLAFSPDGNVLATAGSGGAELWSTTTAKLEHELPQSGSAVKVAFSPDGRLVATAGSDGIARVWFARTGRLYRVLRGHTKPLTGVVFSADGGLLAVSSTDADAEVWNLGTGMGHVLQRGAFGPLAGVAFDPSGRWVAAAGPISVLVWSASSGRQLFYLRGHTDVLTGVSFAPDEPTVLTSSRDGTVRTYTCEVCVDLSSLVHLAEVQLARTR